MSRNAILVAAFAKRNKRKRPPTPHGTTKMMATSYKVLRGSVNLVRNGLAALGVCTVGYLAYEYKNAGAEDGGKKKTKKTKKTNPKEPSKRVLVIPFDELSIVERLDPTSSWPMGGEMRKKTIELRKLVDALHAAASDDSIAAVYGTFGVNPVAADLATLEEIRAALTVIQQSHRRHPEPNIHHSTQVIPKIDSKPLYAYAADGLSDQTYYLASVFTDLHLQKNADLMLWGNSSPSVFLRDFFAKHLIQVHVFKHAEYKTAANLFTHRTYDKFHKQQASVIHQTIQSIMINDIMASRSKALLSSWMGKVEWDDIFKAGTFPAETAWKGGLVDYLPRRDPLPDLLKHAAVGSTSSETPPPEGWCPSETSFQKIKAEETVMLQDYVKELQKKKQWRQWSIFGESVTSTFRLPEPSCNKVALVHMNGMIHGDSIKEVVKSIRDIRNNESQYKCLVLRVNSGGGTITACETVLQELAALSIPVVASFGDMAASGGYYISSHADRIFANRMTKTGSIGIFGIRLDATDFLTSHGVQVETIDTSPLSSTMNPAVPMTKAMKVNFSTMIDRFYEQFKATVAAGRKLPNVEDLAGGRVFLGDAAKSNGLVDEVGGLHRALAYAAREYGADDVVVFPKPASVLQRVVSNVAAGTAAESLSLSSSSTPFLLLLAQRIMTTKGSGSGIYMTSDEATALGCWMDQANVPIVSSWFADANW
jgi:protease IV